MPFPCLKNNVEDQSDSENDEDYVPPQESESEPSDNEDNQNEAVDQQGVITDPEEKKRAREALWSNFQASVSNAASSSSSMAAIQEPRNVKIERRYRFAGEEVVEVVEVPEDSPEAKKWPLWKESLTESSTEAEVSSLPLVPAPSILVTAPSNPSSPPAQMSSPTIPLEPASTSVSTKPPLRKPGPRKPKTSLTPLPGPSSKSKKLSTLDKSAMDWQAHVHAEQHSGLKDELEANRKTGGYLEKVQFLKRVEERKDETLEVLKSNKRRKL